jgi:F-box protein 18 (helicase)
LKYSEFASIPKKRINIVGVPGAGKTTFICELSARLKNESLLYLSFGRENTKNAMSKLPGNVSALSFHAFSKRQMKIESKRITPRYTMNMINNSFQKININDLSPAQIEATTLLMEDFCMSSQGLAKLPVMLKHSRYPKMTSDELKKAVMSFNLLWNATWAEKSNLPVTHDMYLKRLSMVPVKLHYKRIFIDETQDLNDAMVALVNNLASSNPNIQIVRFGDPCQQIFVFRGASTEFSNSQFDFRLQKTHRFGSKLADFCNAIMNDHRVGYYTNIISSNDKTEVYKTPTINHLTSMIKNGRKITYIARYNASLFHLIKHLADKNITYSALGDSHHQEMKYYRNLYQLMQGKRFKSGTFANHSYRSFYNSSVQQNDRQAILACQFVESIDDQGEEIFDKLEKLYVEKGKAQVLLTTIHQAKGMEFRHLVVSGDMPECFDHESKKIIATNREDLHLIYTAITRAKQSIALPKSLYKYYEKSVLKIR